MTRSDRQTIHATCVALGDAGALIVGKSGAGKSDLAFRFVNMAQTERYPEQRHLISDDRVFLEETEDALFAHSPDTIEGLIELRGVGLVAVPHHKKTRVHLVVHLVNRDDVPRIQTPFDEESCQDFMGIQLPSALLYPFEETAPLKLAELIRAAS